MLNGKAMDVESVEESSARLVSLGMSSSRLVSLGEQC